MLVVLRDLLACRECLVREDHLVSLDLRVIEVTMERRDLRELLAKMVQEV